MLLKAVIDLNIGMALGLCEAGATILIIRLLAMIFAVSRWWRYASLLLLGQIVELVFLINGRLSTLWMLDLRKLIIVTICNLLFQI